MTPPIPYVNLSPIERNEFEDKIEKLATECGCWFWGGTWNPRSGYGIFKAQGHQLGAHRVSWMVFRGPIPDGLQVLHKCDTRCCINPNHLFVGTQDDNIKDAVSKGRMASGDRNASRTKPECLKRGSEHGLAKLNEAKILEIRGLFTEGIGNYRISKRYGVCKKTIQQIRRRNTWRHV